MPKHVPELMKPEEFAKGVDLAKFTLKRFWKGDSHPLQLLHKQVADYHKLNRAKLAERHELLQEMIDGCVAYAGSKPAAKQKSEKVQTCNELANLATQVLVLETARIVELGKKMEDPTKLARVGTIHEMLKFERLNKEGIPAIRGDDLVEVAEQFFKVQLTGDAAKDYFAMKKILKQMQDKGVQSEIMNKLGRSLDLVYMSGEERMKYILFISPQAFTDAEGDPYDTKNPSWAANMYAASPQGYIFSCSPKEFGKDGKILHHSSFLGGKDVMCAGMIKCAKGRLIEISNESGHYAPKLEHLVQVCATILACQYDPKDDGYALYLDFAGIYDKDAKGATYRIPLAEFVVKDGKPKDPEAFLVQKDADGVKRPDMWHYKDAAEAKKRGAEESEW